MPDTIPNLWPPQIKIDVQSPFAILSVQAALLGKMTKGILEGTVESEAAKDVVQHRLVVVAPAYKGYRHTLLTAIHNRNLPYPCEVRAEALAEREEVEGLTVGGGRKYRTVYPSAYSDARMLELVRQALRSDHTQAALLSLIAMSNDAAKGGEGTPALIAPQPAE